MARPLSVRDLRLRWLAVERRLMREGELIVTRDGRPVAKLVAYRPEKVARPKWSARRHLAWLSRAWKGDSNGPSSEALLKQDRDER